MCGIVFAKSRQQCLDMLYTLKHRGKDSKGVVDIHTAYWMGHCRLSIVELTEMGRQPYNKHNMVVSFNGEIYNYKELHNLITNSSHKKNRWLMQKPIEVEVLAWLIRKNAQFTRQLDGVYAILAVDQSKQQLTVSRDLYGVMPLYQERRKLIFASERKALVDPVEFPAGTTKVYCLKTKKLKSTFTLDPFLLLGKEMAFDHNILWSFFLEAVKKRITHSDVQVGLALSGGLDSALVAAAAYQLGYHLETVTFALDPKSTEAQNAKQIAQCYQHYHRIISPSLQTIEDSKCRILRMLDQEKINQIKHAAFIRNYFVAKDMRSKVILCGEGADELACGYPSHKIHSGEALEWKSKSTLRSMSAINLDRVNLGGMAWTKEYRVPFLDLVFSQYLMQFEKQQSKKILRELAIKFADIPQEILKKDKYSDEERHLWNLVAKW